MVLQGSHDGTTSTDWSCFLRALVLQTLDEGPRASSYMTLVTRQEKVYQPPFSDETLKLGQGEEFPLVADSLTHSGLWMGRVGWTQSFSPKKVSFLLERQDLEHIETEPATQDCGWKNPVAKVDR